MKRSCLSSWGGHWIATQGRVCVRYILSDRSSSPPGRRQVARVDLTNRLRPAEPHTQPSSARPALGDWGLGLNFCVCIEAFPEITMNRNMGIFCSVFGSDQSGSSRGRLTGLLEILLLVATWVDIILQAPHSPP